VLVVLRFIGLANAAVWLGGAIFFTFVAGPAFFTEEMKQMIPPPYNGAAAMLVIERFFIMQHWCGAIAIAHLVAEWLYAGKPLQKLTIYMLVGIVALNFLGAFWLQPYMKSLHAKKYASKYGLTVSPVEVEKATRSFGAWHGVSQCFNLMIMAGLLVHFWRLSGQGGSPRPIPAPKFRS
jgi:hypothetical protein